MWLLYAPPVPPVRCETVHDLPSRPEGVLGIWLCGEPEDMLKSLRDLRRHPPHAHLPVFVAAELPPEWRHLGDGVAASLEEARRLAQEWRPSVSRLQGGTDSPALALVRYLYLRPLTALAPVRDWREPQAYRYPLLEAFAEAEPPALLLQQLQSRGWLEAADLVDRLRRCEGCRSVHLNYVDVCPSCRSLNIEETPFIHCFTCSHVAPQDKFGGQGLLVCPNCRTRLRHIGTDYNRPLEQMHCRDCAAAFAEPLVFAHCLVCGRAHAPEKLPVLSIAVYALSEAGRQAAREGGALSRPLAAPVPARGLPPEDFIGMTDWMMSLARRHGQAGFTLLGLYLEVPEALERQLGEARLQAMLDAFGARLRELLRDTDILTRVNERLFWIVLPQTTAAGARTLLEKIHAFAAGTAQEDGSRLEVRSVLHPAEEIPAETTAEHLLAALGRRLQRGLPC